MNDYSPDLEFDVTLWRRGESFGQLKLGLGKNPDTGQLLFYFGELTSDTQPPWWLLAERHVRLLDFFLDHRVFFDGKLERSGRARESEWEEEVHEVHFQAGQYGDLIRLLEERPNLQSDEPRRFIPSKTLYALVEILNLIISQMDVDGRIDEYQFAKDWDYFVSLLERG